MGAKYISNKITFLNVILTFLIVILHAKTPERWGLVLDMNYMFIYWVNVLTQIAVPTFFYISGLLFYRKCNFECLERKLQSRVDSLLWPYLIWNVIFVVLFFIMAHIPFLHNKMNMGDVLNSPSEIFNAIINSRYSVLWFVKDLLIFNVFSAAVLFFLRSLRLSIFIWLLSIFFALTVEGGNESVYRWFPMYFSGAIVGRYFLDKSDGSYCCIWDYLSHSIRKLFVALSVGVFMALYILSGLYSDTIFFFIFRLLSPLIIWVLVDVCFGNYLQNKFKTRSWMKYMFFIFCTHQFILNILQKLVVLSYPPTHFILNITFVISPIIVVLLLILLARYLSRFSFYKYLSGGR